MACNPTVQYNDFTGNGSTTAYTFTFPYDNTTDVQVRLGTYPNYTYPSITTEYSVDPANPTVVTFVSAPSGPIRIFRCTPNNNLPATFQPGSAIRSSDLNNNFNQVLYITQDSSIRSVDAQDVADTAYVQSNTAIASATQANNTANSAVTTANGAVNTANSAVATANATQLAVANAVFYAPYANVASIPGSPSNNDYIEVNDSTGIESFSPLSGLPSGFVGNAGLTVRLKYVTNSWVWQNYFANDSESRYLTKNLPVVTGDSTNGSGQITLNCENNSHGIKIKGPPHSAAANYTLTLPNDTGTANQVLSTNGSGLLTWSNGGSPTIDAGNFNTGGSLVTTSQTFDGGSFD